MNLTFLWTLFFRQNNQPNLTKNFYFEGTLAEANKRAIEHCQLMNLSFGYVRPFLTDLVFEERQKTRSFGDRIQNVPPAAGTATIGKS